MGAVETVSSVDFYFPASAHHNGDYMQKALFSFHYFLNFIEFVQCFYGSEPVDIEP